MTIRRKDIKENKEDKNLKKDVNKEKVEDMEKERKEVDCDKEEEEEEEQVSKFNRRNIKSGWYTLKLSFRD